MILLGVAAITFGLLHYLPADPAALIAGRSANAEMIANVRHQLTAKLRQSMERFLIETSRGAKCGQFAIAVARRRVGLDAERFEQPKCA